MTGGFTIKACSYCPVCRGITLADCPHTLRQLDERPYRRDAIDAAIADTERRIVDWLRHSANSSGTVHGKSPSVAWNNALLEHADAISRGDHRKAIEP